MTQPVIPAQEQNTKKVFVTRNCVRCGAPFQISPPSSKKKNCSRSCGAKASKNAKHGSYKTPEYRAWKYMRNRCLNKNCDDYKRYYGSKGITIDPRWDEFQNFLEDMGPKPSPSHSVERIDNSLGYGPDNCKWATKKEQSSNRRPFSEWTFKNRQPQEQQS